MQRVFCAIGLVFAILTNYNGNAIVCYKCDSNTLQACAMSLDETDLPYDECKTSLQCVMSIVDSSTYRGCASNTPTVGATYKKSCGDNLCNKGVYPPGRLKCHQCAGSECVATPAGKPRPCLHHHELDECYTQVLSAHLAYRGCISDTNHTLEPNDNTVLVTCNFNGCNNQLGVRQQQCAQCDSNVSRGCKIDLFALTANVCNITQFEICEVTALLSRPERCYVHHKLDHVVRGCSRDLSDELRQDVAHLCECNDGDLCNTKCLTQQKCIVCDSAKDDWCRAESIDKAASTCGSAEHSSCFACDYNDWRVRRGCGAPPTDEPNVNRCYECDAGTTCNAAALTRCYQCTTATDVTCANWDRPGFNLTIEECTAPAAPCIVATLPISGVTVRGCESEQLHCNASLVSCKSCKGSFCNKGAYPGERLRCHQCHDGERCNHRPTQDPLPCPHSSLVPNNMREACFEYFNTEMGVMTRGCRSNADQYYGCMLHNGGNGCRLCYQDGCNDSASGALLHL